MVKLLELRSLLRAYYQKFQMVVDPLVKFIVAFITFQVINGTLGYEERVDRFIVVFLLSLLSAFTPSAVMVFLALVISVLHVFAVSPILSLVVILMFMILYCFFLRYAPQYGYVVVAVPVLFILNIPYTVPILMGLLATPLAILPTACGVIIYYLFQIISEQAVNSAAEITMDDVLPMYTEVFESILACKQILIVSGVFAVVIIAVYAVRKMKMEYAFEIAIVAGAVVNIFGFLICDLRFNISGEIGSMIIGTLLSVIVSAVVLFFKRVLDYTAVENVQFEDDDYFYYVKAVPKLEIGLQERQVKHITGNTVSEEGDEDDYEEILDEETGEVFLRPRGSSGTGSQVRRQVRGKSNGYLYRQMNALHREEQKKEQADKSFEKERLAAKRYEAGEDAEYLSEEELLKMDMRRQQEQAKKEKTTTDGQ